MKRFLWILVFVLSALVQFDATRALLAADVQKRAPLELTLGQRQLFLDGHGIADLRGLTRTMHSPVKKGAVIEPDQSWEGVLQVRCAPVWDEEQKRYKIWLISASKLFSREPLTST